MTKEECLWAYRHLVDGACSRWWTRTSKKSKPHYLDFEKPMYKGDYKALSLIKNLIEEHFDNPPLKLEELEVGMWVWDKPYKRFLNTGNKYVLCEDGKYHFAPFHDDFLCGNLYDFVNTDGFDDDGNEIGYEIIFKKRFENRFYRKQVEE